MESDATEPDLRRSEASLLCVAHLSIIVLSLIGLDLSLEFLMGRALDNAMLNVQQKDVAKRQFLV